MQEYSQALENQRKLAYRWICGVLIGLSAGVLSAQSVDEDQVRIETEFTRSFSDLVRLNYWSVFERGDEFAVELGVTRKRFDALLAKHSWELGEPPALAYQNSLESERIANLKRVTVTSRAKVESGAFVDSSGQAANPGAAAVVRCDGNRLIITVTCPEANFERTKAVVRRVDNRPEKEKAFWSGDFVTLKPLLYQGTSQDDETRWARDLQKPEASVLTDECVVVWLTPLGVGQDWSNFELVDSAPDPATLQSQLKPRAADANRVFMEDAFYFIAVNPNGATLDVFYDPWGGGTMSPAWRSEAKVTAERSPTGWKVTMEIPWDSLCPTVGKGSVWGLDLGRIRRQGMRPGELSRSQATTLVDCDADRETPGFRNARKKMRGVGAMARPSIVLEPVAAAPVVDWSGAREISRLTDGQGRNSDRTQVKLTHDESNLYIRFDCEEPSLDQLKVVTRHEEDKAYGKGNRRTNFLDRRESWGLDWGDYIEVLLSPELAGTDPYHAGSFQFLVNSHGVLLQRYYDTFGMFTVMPYPDWRSGARVRVDKSPKENHWAVELAIPFSALCEPGPVPKRWGLNLHRCVSRENARATEASWMWKNDASGKASTGDELNLFWSVPEQVFRDPARFGRMMIDPAETNPVARGGTRPVPAPGRRAEAEPCSLERDRSGDRLGSVCFVDATHGWAVGGMGTILHTCDGGETWEEQDSGVHMLLEKVHFVDRLQGWAVGGWPRDYELAIQGGMGVILATVDGGQTWEIQLNSVGGWLSGLTFLDRKQGWAVGEFGTVWRTKDGGIHWEQMRNAPTPAWLYDVHFIDGQRGWTVGRFETVMRTEDGGESWMHEPMPTLRRPFGLSLNFRAVRFANPRQGWIVGQHGTILHSADGGKSWRREELSMDERLVDLINFNDVSVTGDSLVWAVSPFGLMRREPSSGRWKLAPIGTSGWWRSVECSDENHGWITGDRGVVMRTVDGGMRWKKCRDSGRRMGVAYASPHDHHINNSAMVAVGESFDSAYLLMGRSANRPFQAGGDVNTHKTDAVTGAMGVTVGYNFNEWAWRGRDRPHLILERYQHHRGLESIEQRLVAAIRCLQPLIVVAEQPVVQEGYYAHGVGDVARAMVAAYESAGDPDRFPELAALGLEPYAPKKLYLKTMWPNLMYDVHPQTLRLPPNFGLAPRLGMDRAEASLRGRQVFWGLLDRGRPPEMQKPWPGSWSLHLKHSRVETPAVEADIFEGVR